jgi:hypothetical protein
MTTNNFDQFELDLLISYLNHRFGEPFIELSVNDEKVVNIDSRSVLKVSLEALDRAFGPQAAMRLGRWFSIEKGHKGRTEMHGGVVSLVPASWSVFALRGGGGRELYQYFQQKGVLDLLRRDMDGPIHSWVVTEEWILKKYPNRAESSA